MAVTETTRESAEKWVRRWSMTCVLYPPTGSGAGGWLCWRKWRWSPVLHQAIVGASLTDLQNELDMSEGPLVFDLDGSDLPVPVAG
jgi:hypothetical protein